MAVDDLTLEVTLEGATPYFPLLATIWTFFPVAKHVIDEVGAEWYEAGNLVSTGPYMLTEWNHNQNIVLEVNPNYWGEPPTVTRMEYTLFDDEVAQSLVAFENDELDFAYVPNNDVERIRGSDMADQIITIENSRTRFVVCDCTNAPTDDVRVRQALSMGLDRETLANQVRQGHAAPAYTILPKDIPGYNPDAALPEDPEQAKSLLAEAGFEDPSSMEISLVYISTQDYKLDAEYVQGAWTQNLGIKVNLEPIEENTYSDWRASRETQPFNTYIGQWGSDFQDPFNWHNQNFTSQADHYRNHWKNDEFDQLAAEAAVNPDEESRIEQYKEAEVILVHDAPIIPLHHALTFYVAKPYLKGVYLPAVLTVVYGKFLEIEAH